MLVRRQGDPMSTFRLNIMEQGRATEWLCKSCAALLRNLSGIARQHTDFIERIPGILVDGPG